jgi:tetratricopeptide (TPR) repeat protein
MRLRNSRTAILFLGLICCLSVLLTFGTLAAQVSGSTRPEELRSAEKFYAEKNYEAAEVALRSFLTSHPNDFEANTLMGLALTAQRKDTEASFFFRQAVKAYPNSAAGHANLALNLVRTRKPDLAEAEFLKAASLEPENPEYNHSAGEFLASRGKVEAAVPYLRKAQSLRPNYENGYDLALAEMESGQLKEAEADLRTQLGQHPTAELHSLLGEDLEKQQQYLEAAEELQTAATMAPSEATILAWGAELLRHQTLDPAAQVFTKGAELFPKSWKMQLGLGVSQYLLGHNDRAVDAFCTAIDLDPKDPQPYFFLSKVHGIPKEQAEKVSERFERYVKNSPKDARARLYYAMNLWDSDNEQAEVSDLQKVKRLLLEAVALNPKLAEGHLELGILYAKQGDDKAALVEYDRAVTADPSLSTAHFRLGRALVRAGQEERGKKELATWNELKAREAEESEKKRKEVVPFLYETPE